MKIIKRNGLKEEFDARKIINAIKKAFNSCHIVIDNETLLEIVNSVSVWEDIKCGDIEDQVEELLMSYGYYDVAKSYILYREQHKNARYIQDRIDYMNKYMESKDNAASSSETDDNANVSVKNVANLEGEVYKTTNRIIQRRRMRKELTKLFPEVANQYEKDLNSHIIYTHDEASTPVLKDYCMAVSLYPLMVEGVGNLDGTTPSAPNNLNAFCGQIVNAAFLLAAQCKGAVAFGGLFVAFNYYCIKEWGENYYERDNELVTTNVCEKQRTISDSIEQAFQEIVYGWNQPAGNRSYQSPFTNVSYYDSNYFKAIFGDFYYPDFTQPKWDAINYLQKKFIKWFNNERTKTVLTFPVETMALLSDNEDIVDKEYKSFTAEMYSEGHSFFTYISDNADSLSSCCRLRNEITTNEFSFTNGLTGLKTGSCNVITLNLNRILQDYFIDFIPSNQEYGTNVKERWENSKKWYRENKEDFKKYFSQYLISILERIYKYHIAYKTMLYDVEKKGMFTYSNANYIGIKDLFSTIGLNGINEAAMFLGIEVSYNNEYKEFCNLITGTISEQNKLHSTNKFKFNSEFVPAESLGAKNFNWDKEQGYWVPEDGRVLYNSYFYDAHDNTSVLDKFRLHGSEFTSLLDGGVGLHCNLNEHLSKEQYLKLIDFAIKNGTSYFTFNVPNTECNNCKHITKKYVHKCPKCGSENLTFWTRIIGYLRPTKNFSNARQIEERQRTYSKSI